MRNRMPAILLAAAAMTAAADDTPPLTLDDLIVTTATRTATSLDDALANVRVITRRDILASGTTDLRELLRFAAGIDIARTGGTGQQTSIFMRGSESNHTLVLLDGVRMNPATIGVPSIQNISPELIERIEIVTGPRSALYGSDALGGVINIVTQPGERDTTVTVAGGSNHTERAALDTQVQIGATRVSFSADHLRTGGIPTRTTDDTDRGYDNTGGRASLATPLGNGELTVSHWQAEGDTEYSDFFLAPVSQTFTNRVSTVAWRGAPSERWTTELRVGRLEDRVEQRESPDFLDSERWTLDWQNTASIGSAHTLVGGVYLADESAESESFGLAVDEDVDIRALYLQDLWRAGRWQGLISGRLTDHDAFGTEFTWNLGFGVDLNDSVTVQLDAGTAFRAPDATDRFGFGGNPDLDAETSRQIQARIIWHDAGGWRLAAEVFQNDIDDLIDFDFSDFTLRNLAEARIRGARADASWRGADWDVEFGIAYQDARDETADTRLLRRSRASGSLQATRRFGEHSVSVALRSDDARRDFGGVRLSGYLLASVAGELALTERWRMTARVDNVADTDYATASGFRELGRTATVQMRYTW